MYFWWQNEREEINCIVSFNTGAERLTASITTIGKIKFDERILIFFCATDMEVNLHRESAHKNGKCLSTDLGSKLKPIIYRYCIFNSITHL